VIASLNNVAVPNTAIGHPANPTFDCPQSRTVTLQVFNAQVLYQMQVARAGAPSAGSWTPHNGATIPPGLWTFGTDDFGEGNLIHAMRFARVSDINDEPIITVTSA
jgi:hypothetical protein